MSIQRPNILLISGYGRNTGKTTLACRLIEHFCKKQALVAVKVTHHFHPLTYDLPVIALKKDFRIYEEIEKGMPKDSSLMLNAGADRVFFIIAEKESTGKAMNMLLGILGNDVAIICESGGMAGFYKPGLHMHLTGPGNSKHNSVMDNAIEVLFNGESFNLNKENIIFENAAWKLNPS